MGAKGERAYRVWNGNDVKLRSGCCGATSKIRERQFVFILLGFLFF